MRPLLPKNLLFLSSLSFSSSSSSFSSSSPARALLLQISHLTTSSSYPSPSPHYSRRHDEESRNVRVSVWWDFENCNLPAGVNVYRLAQAITEAVRANGIKGPIQITAFGDVLQLSRANQEALSSTGINLTHIPNGGKNSADRSLLVDLMYWVSQNPPPAHLFLISGDRDFAGILHRLRMNNYNILLATPGMAPHVLCSAATIMWQWTSLLKGENLTGKHFNHPPDGPFNSWYGHYKVPLENPFSASEQFTSLQKVEISEPTSDSKLGAIPKSVVKQVWQVLSSHPKGISITDLRLELTKYDVRLEKDFYGHKRFFRFLLSIPHVHLQSQGDGQYFVRFNPPESLEPFDSSAVPSTTFVKNEEWGYAATPKVNGEGKNMGRDADGTPSMASSHEISMEDVPEKFQQFPSQGKPIGDFVDDKSSFPPFVERHAGQPPNELDVADAQLSENKLPPKENEVYKTKTGSLRCKKLSGNENLSPEDVSHKIPEKYTPSENHSAGQVYTKVENNGIANEKSGKFKAEDKYEKPTRKGADKVCGIPYSSPVDDSVVDKIPGGSTETYSKSRTFFSWIRSLWPFTKSSGKSDDLTAHQNKVVSHSEDPKLSEDSEMGQTVGHSGKHELFSNGSFWSDMESFVFTPKGSLLFTQSRSREDVARKLQKDGPLVLRSLSENDILQLVDLLIAEKKWLEESLSQPLPFRLTQPVRKSSLLVQSHGANGLRSLFISRTSQSSLQKSFEYDVEKQNQSITHTGISPSATKRKSNERSRSGILADCQKLVNEILREHPEGYNMGSFRKLFVERYGYHLDIKRLGYQKLASLLQTMPGVKLESTYIFPSVHAVCASDQETSILETQVTNASHAVSNLDSELSDSAPKDDNIDSPWEELGPVFVNNSNQSDLESKPMQKPKALDISKHPDYEPLVLDYDSSESDGDSSCVAQPEGRSKPKCNEQDSSFWQALDSWHSSKEGENSVKKSDNVNVSGNSPTDILNASTELTRGTRSKIPSGNIREKQRSQKSYSFVADPVLPDKEKLIDGILDGLKKVDEAKMQN